MAGNHLVCLGKLSLLGERLVVQTGKALNFPWFLWLLVHSIACPIGILSALWIGLKWIEWLARTVPGEPRLSFGWYPTHEYIGLFLWSAVLFGGAIVGLSVGVAQWVVLSIWRKIRIHWIAINVLAWAISGLALRATILAFTSMREGNFVFVLIPVLVGGSMTGFYLQQALSKVDDRQRQQPDEQSLLYNRLTGYGVVFAGIGAGLGMSLLVVFMVGR